MASKVVGTGSPHPVVAVSTGAGGALGAAAASPSPSSAGPSAECCMCGDHGLACELFRCRSCHVRYQHKYCSDLYPKVESYRSCNWCLREEVRAGAGAGAATANKSSIKHTNNNHHSTTTPSSNLSHSSSKLKGHYHHHHTSAPSTAATADQTNHRTINSHSRSSSSTSTADNNSTGSTGANMKQLQRGGDYAAHLLAKPLKKLRPTGLERSASEVIVRVKAAEEMGAPAAAASRRFAGGRQAVRGKIRRYKLLEEVSS